MTTKGNDNTELFSVELDVLSKGKEKLFDPQYRSNELLNDYRDLLTNYEKLLKLTKRIFTISDSQGLAIKKRESELQNLLDHVNQGFLTFGKSLIVHRQFSAECMRFFRGKISGSSIIDLLWENDEQKQTYAATLYTILTSDNEDLIVTSLQQLPNFIELNNRFVHLEFKLISQLEDDEHSHNMILLILTDITEKKLSKERVEYLQQVIETMNNIK